MGMSKGRHYQALTMSDRTRNKQDVSNVTFYSPFSLKGFDRYEANASHVART